MKRQPLTTALKIAAGVIIVVFLARSVIKNWETVGGYDWSFDPGLFALSCAVFGIAYALLPWIWRSLLGSMGYRLGFAEAWRIYYVGNLGRYVPGKVWAVAGMAYMAGQSGIPAVRAGAAAVIAQVYSLVSSVVIFLFFLIFNEIDFPFQQSAGVLVPAGLAGALMFILFPRFLERALNIFMARLGREPVSLGISTLTAVKIVALYGLSWILFGMAFWLLISSVAGLGKVGLLFATGVWAAAYTVGFLAFFVPGGIGVREWVLGLLFASALPVEVGIVVAGISRLVVTAIEIVYVLISLLYKGIKHGET